MILTLTEIMDLLKADAEYQRLVVEKAEAIESQDFHRACQLRDQARERGLVLQRQECERRLGSVDLRDIDGEVLTKEDFWARANQGLVPGYGRQHYGQHPRCRGCPKEGCCQGCDHFHIWLRNVMNAPSPDSFATFTQLMRETVELDGEPT